MRPLPAVIPAGGLGTRMAPLARVLSKELLPLGRDGAIVWSLREARLAGAREACVVVAPAKKLLIDYLQSLEPGRNLPEITLVYQTEPRGLGDAIACARQFTGRRPFAVLLPDNLFWGPEPAIGPLLDLHARYGRPAVGLVARGRDHDPRRSSASIEQLAPGPEPGVFRVTSVAKPPAGSEAPPVEFLGVGRYVLPAEFHECVEEVRAQVEGELDDIQPLTALLARGEVLATCVPGYRYDVGNWAGYEAAFVRFAGENPEP